jgi:hypothetical protein
METLGWQHFDDPGIFAKMFLGDEIGPRLKA